MSTFTREEGRRPTETGVDTDAPSLTTVHKAAIGLAAVTALIHLYIGVTSDLPVFILAAAGFFFGIGSLFMLGRRGRVVLYALGILYTGGQITLWLLLGMPSPLLAVPDKLVQTGLIAMLAWLAYQDGQRLTHTR
jgi:hypothetical protein